MNVKKAKALRRAVGFKPSDDREYSPMLIEVTNGAPRIIGTTRVNASHSSRTRYLKAKKAANVSG